MSIIEKAVQRLEELKRAGVTFSENQTEDKLPSEEAVPQPPPPLQRSHAATAAEAPKAASPIHISEGDIALAAASSARPTPRGSESSRYVEIDLERLSTGGMVTPDSPRSQIADEFRVIKRPLLSNAQGKGATQIKNGNLIMITSSMPGEGKSFSAINLAMSIAMELDSRVLLVDADVSRPSVLKVLGLPPARGLMDVLSGEIADLGEVMMRTNVEKLTLLPAATLPRGIRPGGPP